MVFFYYGCCTFPGLAVKVVNPVPLMEGCPCAPLVSGFLTQFLFLRMNLGVTMTYERDRPCVSLQDELQFVRALAMAECQRARVLPFKTS